MAYSLSACNSLTRRGRESIDYSSDGSIHFFIPQNQAPSIFRRFLSYFPFNEKQHLYRFALFMNPGL